MSEASPVPRPLSVVLDDLLKVGACILERPPVAFSFRERLDDVAGETVAWSKRMADQRIVDDTALWFAQSLRNIINAPGPITGGPPSTPIRMSMTTSPTPRGGRRAMATRGPHGPASWSRMNTIPQPPRPERPLVSRVQKAVRTV